MLVTVAPVDPYPSLFAAGPATTWAGTPLSSEIYLRTYSGRRMGKKRRQFSDLRDLLRFPGKMPSDIHTVDERSKLMRSYEIVMRPIISQKSGSASPQTLRKILAPTTRVLLQSINQLCRYSSRVTGRIIQRGRNRPVHDDGQHLWSNRYASMTNHLRIQRDVLNDVLRDQSVGAIIMCTASVYLHLPRLLHWVRHEATDYDFASLRIPGASEWSYGGTVVYFSRTGAEKLVNEVDLSYGDLQDVAIGRWIRRTAGKWTELPAAQYQNSGDEEACLLCQDLSAVAVVCTSAADRDQERVRMAILHNHESHQY